MTILRLILTNRWAQGLAVGLAFLALIFALDRCASYAMRAMTRSATEAGVQKERAESSAVIINQVEKANAAAEKVRRAGGAERADCLRDNRHPENC